MEDIGWVNNVLIYFHKRLNDEIIVSSSLVCNYAYSCFCLNFKPLI